MKHNVMLLLAVAACGGCVDTSTRGCPTFVAPMEAVVAEFNANAAAVDWLVAKARITMTVQNEGGWAYTWGGLLGSANGTVLFEKDPRSPLGPHYFAFVGKEASRPVFWLGVNPDEGLYYIWIQMGDKGGAWVGQTALSGAPGQAAMPIDPLGMISLLNVTELPFGDQLPLATLTVEGPLVRSGLRQPPSYVLTYIDRQPGTGRPLSRREVYFEWTEPERLDFRKPYKIVFRSPEGRRMMTARLRDYTDLPDVTAADGRPAVVPTRIELENTPWPGVPTVLRSMSITLLEIRTAPGEGGGIPKEASELRRNLPDVQIHWIDELSQKGAP